MAAAVPQLFGIIPTGSPIIVTPTSIPSQTSFIYTVPASARGFSHIVVFLLPGTTLPPNAGAAVYVAFPSQPNNFRFLGAIGEGKESAVFKVRDKSTSNNANGMADSTELILGIDIEPAESISAQMASLASYKSGDTAADGNALVLAGRPPPPTTTLLLAQRIIKNAFNFLASFSGNVPVPGGDGVAGVEVVPLKAFEDWWRKFENKVKNDPSFLERDTD